MFGTNLRSLIEAEESNGVSHFRAVEMAVNRVKRLLKSGAIKPDQIDIKELAEAFCGTKWVALLDPALVGDTALARRMLEADDAVDVTAFSTITGQIVYTAVHQGYEDEAFIGNQLVRTMPTKLQSEKIPGFESISDEALVVEEGMPYPYAGFGESFQITPLTVKYGLAIALTKEAIFFDRTGQFVEQANKIGFRLGIRKEKEILDMVIGALNNYNWRNLNLTTFKVAPLIAGQWVNDFVNSELLDWNTLDQAGQDFQQVKNPDTGDPIVIGGRTILVPPSKAMTAMRIVSATEIRETTGGTETLSSNPVRGTTTVSSQLLFDRIIDPSTKNGRIPVQVDPVKAVKYWWYGDFPKAFRYNENWALTVLNAPAGSEPEFSRDITMRWRASERGVASVFDPRYVQRRKLTL